MTALAASPALGGREDSAAATPAESAAEAVLECLVRACRPALCGPGGRGFAVSVLDDVRGLLQCGRPAVVCALADLQRAFQAALADAAAASAAVRRPARPSTADSADDAEMRRREPSVAASEQPSTAAPAAGYAIHDQAEQEEGRRAAASSSDRPTEEAAGASWTIDAHRQIAGIAHQERSRGRKRNGSVRRQLQAAERKLSYFQSWANEQRAQGLQDVLQAVAAEASLHRYERFSLVACLVSLRLVNL